MRKTVLAALVLCFAPAAASAQGPGLQDWTVNVRWTSDVGGVVYDGKINVKVIPGLPSALYGWVYGAWPVVPPVGAPFGDFVSEVRMTPGAPAARAYFTGVVTGAAPRN